MFHSTAFTADYRATRDALVRLLGMRVLEYTEATDPAIGRAGGMTWIGDNSLELGQPLTPDGPQGRWLSKFGGGNHSVAVQVEDIVAAVDHLRGCGVRIHRAATGYPYHVMFTDPRDVDGVFIEWFQGAPPFDPRWGASLPEEHLAGLVPVDQQAWVGAVVREPGRTAERVAELCATSVTFEHADASPGSPVAGVSLGDCTLALYRLPGDDTESMQLWGRPHRHPKVSLLTLRVADLDRAREGLAAAGATVVRSEAGLIVVKPDVVTGHVELAFTDGLLPGDPRMVQ